MRQTLLARLKDFSPDLLIISAGERERYTHSHQTARHKIHQTRLGSQNTAVVWPRVPCVACLWSVPSSWDPIHPKELQYFLPALLLAWIGCLGMEGICHGNRSCGLSMALLYGGWLTARRRYRTTLEWSYMRTFKKTKVSAQARSNDNNSAAQVVQNNPRREKRNRRTRGNRHGPT